MRSYFDMLNLPPTATPEEIKTHYEYLTHLYHPGHFSNPLEIMHAKRKCQALTAAYHSLMGLESELTKPSQEVLIGPRVEPALIDWGIVRQGTQLSAQVRIRPGNSAQHIVLTRVDKAKWLTIDRSGQIEVEGDAPIVVEVVAHTKRLTTGKKYSGQIKVNIDAVTMHVVLMVQVTPPFSGSLADDRESSPAVFSINSFRPYLRG